MSRFSRDSPGLKGFVPVCRSVYQKVPVSHSVRQYSPTPGTSAPVEIIFFYNEGHVV